MLSGSSNGKDTMVPKNFAYRQTMGSAIVGFIDVFMMNKLYSCTGIAIVYAFLFFFLLSDFLRRNNSQKQTNKNLKPICVLSEAVTIQMKLLYFNWYVLIYWNLFSEDCKALPLCKNGGYPHPRDCSKCQCPGGFGGKLCNEKVSTIKLCKLGKYTFFLSVVGTGNRISTASSLAFEFL